MPRHEPSSPSTRSLTHAKLLQEALDRPGVPDVMRVYQDWSLADRGLDPHQAVNRAPQNVRTTDHANQR